MSNKISAYIQLYHDLQFLKDIIKGINDYVDEIVIIDGPYKYCENFLKLLNLYYDENTKPDELNDIIRENNKIKYYYGLWDDERQKRIYGYSKCNNDIVLLVDCDEFFTFDTEEIKKFIQSDKKVARFKINNMNRININIEPEIVKYIMFKKKYVNEIQHLSYTWLIGVKDLEPKNINYMDITNSMGTIYHQTLNRNKYNNIIKFIFYTRLHSHLNDKNAINKIHGYDVNMLKTTLSNEELLNVFYHSAYEFIGVPRNKILTKNDNVLIDLTKYKNNHLDAYFTNDSIILTNIEYHFYMSVSDKMKIFFENVKTVNITIKELNVNCEFKNVLSLNSNVINNELLLNLNIPNEENIGYLWTVKCSNTYDGIYSKIKNIITL